MNDAIDGSASSPPSATTMLPGSTCPGTSIRGNCDDTSPRLPSCPTHNVEYAALVAASTIRERIPAQGPTESFATRTAESLTISNRCLDLNVTHRSRLCGFKLVTPRPTVNTILIWVVPAPIWI